MKKHPIVIITVPTAFNVPVTLFYLLAKVSFYSHLVCGRVRILEDVSDLTTTTIEVSHMLLVNALRACFCLYSCVCSSSIYCRAPSIPEAHDLSRSSSNASSFASVVEENETEATEDYDTGMVRTAH